MTKSCESWIPKNLGEKIGRLERLALGMPRNTGRQRQWGRMEERGKQRNKHDDEGVLYHDYII